VVEVEAGGLRVVELSGGRDRAATVEYLARLAGEDPRTLVGLDFPFSYATPFLDHLGAGDFPALCARMRVEARRLEAFLADRVGPWWARWHGDPLRTRRLVERQPLALGAESPLRALARPAGGYGFTGPRQAGKAAITGIAAIGELLDRAPHVRVWPFDDLGTASCVVAEIWPRLALPGIVKTRRDRRRERVAALAAEEVRLDAAHRRQAEASADAFDALQAAVAMGRGCWPLVPRAALPPEAIREGWILGVPWPPCRQPPEPGGTAP
jgi:hypothetical protein